MKLRLIHYQKWNGAFSLIILTPASKFLSFFNFLDTSFSIYSNYAAVNYP